MSMRTIERQDGSDNWNRSQSAELVNGTLGIVACFVLVCLFLMAMVH